MTFICLWSPATAVTDGKENDLLQKIIPGLLGAAPRVLIGANGIVWADARGMSAEPLARDLLGIFRGNGVDQIRAALSAVPVCAEVAARYGNGGMIVIEPGTEREYIAGFPVGVLEPSLALASLLDGIGIECCGDLARLDLESIEVRFGGEGARVWRLSRADDSRRI